MESDLNPACQEAVDGLTKTLPDKILEIYRSTGSTFVRIKPDAIVEASRHLHDEHRYIFLSDIFGTDRYTSSDRFEVVYNLLSLRDRQRLFLKVWLPEEDPEVDSVCSVWKAANWFEREVYDMFGIRFRNHPDHRRIYMPEDFRYYPLRKEFPLLGIPGSIDLPSTTPDTE